jgi:Tfp pilus assembly protein FimV
VACQLDGAWPSQSDRWWWWWWWWRRWRRPGRLAGVAVGLMLVERLLVREMGSPTALARTLGDLGDPWADPVASVLALMALTAEALVGYLLLVLALRALGAVPGLTGHAARRIVIAVTPAVVRRLVDLLVGGTLLVQVALAAPGASPAHRSSGPYETVAASSALSRSDGPAATGDLALPSRDAARLRRPADQQDPVGARPTLRRSAAPLPPWLGGGPSTAAPGHRAGAGGYRVEPGDTLWDIAAAHLVPAERSAVTIHRYWRQVYRANRSVVGADPDVIHPGTRLGVTPYRRDRR